MATDFPTSIQDLDATRGTSNQKLSSPSHVTHHRTEDDTIEALQAKVGVDGSAVTTSHDYKLSEVTSTDKAVGKSASQTLTNKTIDLGDNTVTGTTAEFNDALSDDDFATLGGSETLANKTLTEPTIGDFTNATHDHEDNAGGGQLNATNVFSGGTVPTARLGSGTASSSTFLRGDQAWAAASVTANSGYTSRALDASTGTATVAHGLGAAPKRVRITGTFAEGNTGATSTKVSYATLTLSNGNQEGIYMHMTSGDSSSSNSRAGQGFRLYATSGSGNESYQSVTLSVDATNITFNWIQNIVTGSTGTGTGHIQWEAVL